MLEQLNLVHLVLEQLNLVHLVLERQELQELLHRELERHHQEL